MRKRFKSFIRKTPVETKEVVLTSIGIILSLAVLRGLGLLQPLELKAYDLLFFLRSAEPKDERIVIVAWDEEDLQMAEEGTMSDNTLSVVLEKINQQQPRIIGLDLFRDVPVPSRQLTDEENEKAYNNLQNSFRSTPNLVGIETVIPPIINPSKILKDRERTAAADLLRDSDGTIRRAYIHPLEDEAGNPASIPSLGVVLGFQYLADEGFEADKTRSNALKIFNSKTGVEITLEPLKKLDGSYIEKESGTLIPVNWRTGNSRFERVFVSEVATGLVPPDIFKDKIVLIGNVSASGADKHYLPINRWNSDSITTNGVEIHAQIASSIISAALDGRALIKTIPEWSEWILAIAAVVGTAFIAKKNRVARPGKIILITTTGALVIICGLVVFALLAFSEGYWIPIVPAILGALATPLTISLSIYINKIKAANKDFRLLLKDLNHSIKNPLSSIEGNAEFGLELCQHLDNARTNYDDFGFIEELENIERQLGQPPLTNLRKLLESVYAQSLQIKHLRNSSQEYFSVAYSEEVFRKVSLDLNQLIRETVKRIFKLKSLEYNCHCKLLEDYEEENLQVTVNKAAFERIIENLIDNAFRAIYERINKTPKHQGVIKVQTRKTRRKIEFCISDNGIGIPDSIIEQIFLPFKSFNASTRKGQGMGLALARTILYRHNGEIKVKSQHGQGSKFIIQLNT
ncbi:CHASE2 domain-containing protein [Myxosarcina sp. GI1]|uniref:CHASE2 domain-containing protein n=1 Tax=Myxosarcina sp. GI1 TaxID=1541065 RepID=UPI00155A660F|nr:CHASE2 domain-containing protein [Myxosarcina sp. GI1]